MRILTEKDRGFPAITLHMSLYELIPPSEAAAMLGESNDHVLELIHSRRLPAWRYTVPGQRASYRVRKSDVRQLLLGRDVVPERVIVDPADVEWISTSQASNLLRCGVPTVAKLAEVGELRGRVEVAEDGTERLLVDRQSVEALDAERNLRVEAVEAGGKNYSVSEVAKMIGVSHVKVRQMGEMRCFTLHDISLRGTDRPEYRILADDLERWFAGARV